MTNAERTPTSPEARLPWPAGAGGDDARGLRQSDPRALTGAPWLWATFCQRPREVAGRACPRSAKAMLRPGRRVRPTGKRRRRRLRLRCFARGGSAGALRNQHVCVPSASHTDRSVPSRSDRAAGRPRRLPRRTPCGRQPPCPSQWLLAPTYERLAGKAWRQASPALRMQRSLEEAPSAEGIAKLLAERDEVGLGTATQGSPARRIPGKVGVASPSRPRAKRSARNDSHASRAARSDNLWRSPRFSSRQTKAHTGSYVRSPAPSAGLQRA